MPTDPWMWWEVLLPLYAASGIGYLVGSRLRPAIAVPTAAVADLLVVAVFATYGRGPLSSQTTYGTMTGIERPPWQAIAALVSSAALACLCVLLTRNRTKRGRLSALAAVLALGLVVLPVIYPWHDPVFRVTKEPIACAPGIPEICGPRSRLPLLKQLQSTMAEAYASLIETPVVAPRRFTVTRYDHYSDLRDSAPLDFDPALLKDGRYSVDGVARILARPHQCKELFAAESATRILDAQDVVIRWVQSVLSGTRSATPVPLAVVSAYEVIETCQVMTNDLH